MKKLKQRFELVGRLLLILATLFTNFAGIMPVLASDLGYSHTKGEVIDSVNSKGSTNNPGNAEIIKTVRKTDEDGVYQIDLSVKGKDKVTSESQTAPIYAAVVLDNSGSMKDEVCVKYETKWYAFIPVRKCVEKVDKKYGEAIKGAKAFANTLLSKYSSAELALVTFSTDVEEKRAFSSENFDNVTFPSAEGLTNLGGAIKKADDMLKQKKSEVPNAKLYMVILSDGYPEGNQIDYNAAANNAKNVTKAEIFTIGYDTDNRTEALLKSIATDEDHYSNADGSNIVDKFTNIVGQMEVRVPAGTNATIKDVIGDEFEYIDGSKTSDEITVDGKNVTVDVRNITEEEKTYSFLVKINKDAKDGLHETNASCKLEYKNVDGNNDSLELDKSAKVYWEAQRYPYTINYYKNSVSSENYINDVKGSAVLNTEIKLSDIELNKYKPAGYKDGIVKTTLPYIIKDGTNVINIVYEVRDDLSYVVEYYKETDDNNEEKISDDNDNTVNNVFFGQKIDFVNLNKYKNGLGFGYKDGSSKDLPYTIKEEDNVIKVCYERRRDMSYTVKYLEKDTNTSLYNDKEVTNKTYNETYEEEAKDAPYGYKLVSDKKQSIKLDKENNVVTFYYEKRNDMSYKVRYVELVGNYETEILPSKDVLNRTYGETYEEEAEEAPFGYKLVRDKKQSFTLKEDGTTITFYYEKRTDMSYKVKYLEEGTEKNIIPDKEVTNKTYNEEVTEYADSIYGYDLIGENSKSIKLDKEDKVIIFYYKKIKANYIVRYVEEGTNNEVAPSVKKEGNLVDPVEEEAIEVRGYKLVSDNKVTVELNSREETEIIFYYEKIKVSYTVKYLDNTTKEEIMASVNKDGLFFDKVTEKAPSIDGYKLASLDEITIELNEDNNEIVFYYDKVVQVVKTGVHENNNDYILFVALLGSLTALGYSLKKRFN